MPHQRRKSGHGSGNTSMVDVRKSVTVTDLSRAKRPAMSRKQTPVSLQKLGRSPRERQSEWQSDSWDDERESFPQYCMTCEKQFMPYDDKFLYCSESCRRSDLATSSQRAESISSYSSSHYKFSPAVHEMDYDSEARDIVPRASPSRPESLRMPWDVQQSVPASADARPAQQPSSAISALRSLNAYARPPSPPSPSASSRIWPFARSAATSPSTSYSRPSFSLFSSTYDGTMGDKLDRGLPARHPQGHGRPQSIEFMAPRYDR